MAQTPPPPAAWGWSVGAPASLRCPVGRVLPPSAPPVLQLAAPPVLQLAAPAGAGAAPQAWRCDWQGPGAAQAWQRAAPGTPPRSVSPVTLPPARPPAARGPAARAVAVPVQVVSPAEAAEPTAAQSQLFRRIEDVVSEIEREMEEPLDELQLAGCPDGDGSTLCRLEGRLQTVERREAPAARRALLSELRRILVKGARQGRWSGAESSCSGRQSLGACSVDGSSVAGGSEAGDMESRLREVEAACRQAQQAAEEARRGRAAAERDLEALGRHSRAVLEDCHALQARLAQLEGERRGLLPEGELLGSSRAEDSLLRQQLREHEDCAARLVELEALHTRTKSEAQDHLARLAELEDLHAQTRDEEQRHASCASDFKRLHATTEARLEDHMARVAQLEDLLSFSKKEEQHHASRASVLQNLHAGAEARLDDHADRLAELEGLHAQMRTEEQHHMGRATELEKLHAQAETSLEHRIKLFADLEGAHARAEASAQHHASLFADLESAHTQAESNVQRHLERILELEGLHAEAKRHEPRLAELQDLHQGAQAREEAALEREREAVASLRALEQQLLEAEQVRLGQGHAEARRLLDVQAEHEELRRRLVEAESLCDDHGQRHRSLQDTMADLEAQLAEARGGVGDEGARREAALRAEVLELERRLADERVERDLGAQQQLALGRRAETLEGQLLVHERERGELEQRLGQLERELSRAHSEEQHLRHEVAAAAKSGSGHEAALEAVRVEQQSAREASEGLARDLEVELARERHTVSELRADVQALQAELARERHMISELRAEVKAAKGEAEEERRATELLQGELRDARDQSEELQRHAEEALRAADEAREARDIQLRQLRQRVRELEAAEAQASPTEAHSAAEEVGSLRSRPSILGFSPQASPTEAPSSTEEVGSLHARPSIFGFASPEPTAQPRKSSVSSHEVERNALSVPLYQRPSVSDVPSAYLQVLERIESQGWETVTWKDGYTMLHWAASKGHAELCRYLVGLRADLTAHDKFDRTPLDYASQTGHRRTSHVLEALVPEPLRPASASSARSSGNEVQDLSNPRESVSMHSMGDSAPARPSLQSVPSMGDSVAARPSLSGLSVGSRLLNARASDPGLSASPAARPSRTSLAGPSRTSLASPSPGRRASMPPAYLDVIRQVDQVGWQRMHWARGFTLLHWAAQNDDAALCARFLAMGADPGQRDDGGKTALDYARERGSANALAELERAAARPSASMGALGEPLALGS